MLDKKKIEEAAYNYSQDNCGFSYNMDELFAFQAGANWAIQEFLKDLWHDANEKPKYKTLILADIELTGTSNHVYEGLYFYKKWELNDIEDKYLSNVRVVRWFYIDDLLPKKKGGEQ